MSRQPTEIPGELLDLRLGLDAHVGGQQAFAVAQLRVNDLVVHALEIEQASIALHLSIERWLAIDEDDREAELLGEEVA